MHNSSVSLEHATPELKLDTHPATRVASWQCGTLEADMKQDISITNRETLMETERELLILRNDSHSPERDCDSPVPKSAVNVWEP